MALSCFWRFPRRLAADLKDYLAKSMGVKLGKGSGLSMISVAVDPTLEKLQSKIVVGPSSIRITGVTPREAAQGCYRLEDLMTARGIPAVKIGSRTFTRMFSPRMTHSGWEIEKFPEVYMDQAAHAGMDAILVLHRLNCELSSEQRINRTSLHRENHEFVMMLQKSISTAKRSLH